MQSVLVGFDKRTGFSLCEYLLALRLKSELE